MQQCKTGAAQIIIPPSYTARHLLEFFLSAQLNSAPKFDSPAFPVFIRSVTAWASISFVSNDNLFRSFEIQKKKHPRLPSVRVLVSKTPPSHKAYPIKIVDVDTPELLLGGGQFGIGTIGR